jgi:hypothetical protein
MADKVRLISVDFGGFSINGLLVSTAVSHVLRSLVGMSYDTYYSFAQYGFTAVLIVINIPLVGQVLEGITFWSYDTKATWFGMGWLV